VGAGSPRRRLHVGDIIRNAVVFNFKNWQSDKMASESLLETVDRLFSMLHEWEIDYVLVGGIAVLQYVEGRNTEDIDLIMALSSLKKLPEVELVSQEDDFARGLFQGLQIDLLLTQNPLFDKVRREYATVHRFAEREIPCATVEGLLILKLYALPSLYRQGNFARVGLYENDIATLMHEYRPEIEPLLEELTPHLSETDLKAVQQIVSEIQERIARFDARSESAPP
jgi:hypothetical protein